MLDVRRIKFAQEYIANGGNAADAARTAGVTEVSAKTRGSEYLCEFEVQCYIELLKDQMAESARIDRERMVLELKRVALSDPRRLYDDQGALIPISDLPDDVAAAVESMEYDNGMLTKVKMSSKVAALRDLGKMFSIFDDHEKAGKAVINIVMSEQDLKL
jgi:hypothetical protein